MQDSLKILGVSTQQVGIEELFDRLLAREKELELEKSFGSHSAAASWFLRQLSEASQGIEKNELPLVSSMQYTLDAKGCPRMDIQWSCPKKESSRLIKSHLQGMSGLRIAKWKEQSQTYFITLEQL